MRRVPGPNGVGLCGVVGSGDDGMRVGVAGELSGCGPDGTRTGIGVGMVGGTNFGTVILLWDSVGGLVSPPRGGEWNLFGVDRARAGQRLPRFAVSAIQLQLPVPVGRSVWS